MAITPELKLANQISEALSNKDFMMLTFAWQITQKSPRTQADFWEAIWSFIEHMADSYERGLTKSLNLHVAETCYFLNEVMKHRYVDHDELQMTLFDDYAAGLLQ